MAEPRALGLETRVRQVAERVLGERPRAVILVNSWRGDFSTVAGLVFTQDRRRPVAAFKAATGSRVEPAVLTEHENLKRLEGALPEPYTASVPRVLHLERGGDLTLVLSTPARGRHLVPPVRPSARPHWLDAVLGAVARWLVAFHEGVGEPARALEGERFEALVLEPFERYLEAFAVGPRERRFLERVRRRAEGLRGVRLSVVPQHGDLCAANVFLGGAAPVEVIDWEEPMLPTLPLMDLFHFASSAGLSGDGELDADGLRLFRAVFLEDSALKQALAGALRLAGSVHDLDQEGFQILAVLYWVGYALEKVAAVRELHPDAGRTPFEPSSAELNAFGSARFGDGTCLNLRLMAEHEKELATL